MKAMTWYMATQYSMIFPMSLSFVMIGVAVIAILLIFIIAVRLTYRKITDISLAEALKVYQGVT
jgi:ABC-type antimicrobial peptide transport system permease subunit